MKLMASYTSRGTEGQPDSLKMMVWPDSAIIKTGKPLFLSDEFNVRVHPGIGVKITGVGKSIASRFARKYYDEVFPLAFILPEKISGQLERGENPIACEYVADFSVITGNPVSSEKSLSQHKFEISLRSLMESNISVENDFNSDIQIIDQSIEEASRHNTLKTGDIVGFISPSGFDASANTLLSVKFDDDILIENKLK